jgi:hypothetical protein
MKTFTFSGIFQINEHFNIKFEDQFERNINVCDVLHNLVFGFDLCTSSYLTLL